jgi:hypothetical protein
MGTNDLENLVVQSLKDGAIWVACENSGIDQFSFYHPFIHEEKKADKDPE